MPNLSVGVEGLCPFNQFSHLLRRHPCGSGLDLDEQHPSILRREDVDGAVRAGAPSHHPPVLLQHLHHPVLLGAPPFVEPIDYANPAPSCWELTPSEPRESQSRPACRTGTVNGSILEARAKLVALLSPSRLLSLVVASAGTCSPFRPEREAGMRPARLNLPNYS